jgi:hypothetical protein
MTKLYDASAAANQIVADMQDFKNKGEMEKLREYVSDPEKMASYKMSEALKPIMKQEAELRKVLGVLANQPDSEANRAKIREVKYAANKLAERASKYIKAIQPE